jgi:VanZ family protein
MPPGMRRTLALWLPVLAWAAVIFGISAIPSPSTGLGEWDTVLRKGAHMVEYAVLAVLLWRALRDRLAALLIAVAYAGTDELHQAFVRGRHASPVDVAFDGIGAAAGLVLLLHAQRVRTAR